MALTNLASKVFVLESTPNARLDGEGCCCAAWCSRWLGTAANAAPE
jgi:hypothetical protein